MILAPGVLPAACVALPVSSGRRAVHSVPGWRCRRERPTSVRNEANFWKRAHDCARPGVATASRPSDSGEGDEGSTDAKPAWTLPSLVRGSVGWALAGLCGLRRGAKVTVYEQAPAFERLGAGIQMSPDAMHVLRALGLEPLLRQMAFQPPAWDPSRLGRTGGTPRRPHTFGAEAEERYGALPFSAAPR